MFFVGFTVLPILVPSTHVTTWETLLSNNRMKELLIRVSISKILLAEKEVIQIADF